MGTPGLAGRDPGAFEGFVVVGQSLGKGEEFFEQFHGPLKLNDQLTGFQPDAGRQAGQVQAPGFAWRRDGNAALPEFAASLAQGASHPLKPAFLVVGRPPALGITQKADHGLARD